MPENQILPNNYFLKGAFLRVMSTVHFPGVWVISKRNLYIQKILVMRKHQRMTNRTLQIRQDSHLLIFKNTLKNVIYI